MSDEIEDLLKTLYESNEHYHNAKERVVWLAGVVYLTFSVALIAFLNQGGSSIPAGLEKYAAVFLLVIFVLTTAFVWRQTWEKVRSVVKTGQLNKLILELQSRRTYADLMDAYRYPKEQKKIIPHFVCLGWSGHLIFGVVYSFFLAQMAALCGPPNCWV